MRYLIQDVVVKINSLVWFFFSSIKSMAWHLQPVNTNYHIKFLSLADHTKNYICNYRKKNINLCC